jgi:NAD+ kinase
VSDRTVLIVTHTGRPAAVSATVEACRRLQDSGIDVRLLAAEAADMDLTDVTVVQPEDALDDGVELVVVVGGDGSLLRAAELARPVGTPLLGVNLGRVGFLAEAEPEALDDTIDGVVGCNYTVEERMTLDVDICRPRDGRVDPTCRGWALNEASVEKATRERMLEAVVEVDGRPLTRWGCDGVVLATPTGSTAYAFSAGGPVVWPKVEALLLVPISAHALFSRPLVAAPDSVLAVEIKGETAAVLACDGRRTWDLEPGTRVEVRRGAAPVRLARLHERPFTDRLVKKFHLPVHGWRGPSD